MGEGIVREFGIYTYTLLYLKWTTNKDLLCSTGNSAQCPVAAWMEGEFGGEWIHVHVRLAMAPHSNILAQGTPWTEEPGRLQSTWSQSDMTEATQHTGSDCRPISIFMHQTIKSLLSVLIV